jgi:hypothetical protein
MRSLGMKKVFISYVKENVQQIEKICEIFKKNKIKFWIDREQINPGKMWKLSIEEGINNGSFFLACFSSEFQEKSQTYMNEELLCAISLLRQKHLDKGWFIPIKLSPCTIPRYNIGGSTTLQDLQYIDLSDNWDLGMERLVDAIKQEEETNIKNSNEGYYELVLTYRGLKSIIENGSGFGFHNADLGHPVYKIGATGASKEFTLFWEYADTPQKNKLFQMLSKLSKELKSQSQDISSYVWWYDFSDWKSFCKYVVQIYDEGRKT